MCGRKTLTSDIKNIIQELFVEEWKIENYRPSYNIAPSHFSPVLIEKNNLKKVIMMRWGLIHKWSKNHLKSSNMINARLETILEKKTYMELVTTNRCIVITDGYFEWKFEDNKKTPYYIKHAKNKLLPMAGLWTIWKSNEITLMTYTVITTKAQKSLCKIHHRMPMILEKKDINNWINCKGGNEIDNIKTFNPDNLDFFPVSDFVNSPKNNSIKCIKPYNKKSTLNMFQT